MMRSLSSRRLFSGSVSPLRNNFNNFPNAKETKLNNGMTVLSLNNGSPLATVGLWVKTGSRYEQPDQAGAAHFLEHMFFKVTIRLFQLFFDFFLLFEKGI
jgi:predicted Zn-dependent peptidase